MVQLRRSVLKSGAKLSLEGTGNKQDSGLADSRRPAFDNKPEKARIFDNTETKSAISVLSKPSLRSRNVEMRRMPLHVTPLLNREVGGSNVVTASLMQNEQRAGQFLSVQTNRGRVIKAKTVARRLARYASNNAGSKRLSNAQRLQLLQALADEPLTSMELRFRFGASKETTRRLVKNGLLVEVWGPKTIGARFRLSTRGKRFLKRLEAVSKYEPRMGEARLVKVKQRASAL